jgi:hypothetical protein
MRAHVLRQPWKCRNYSGATMSKMPSSTSDAVQPSHLASSVAYSVPALASIAARCARDCENRRAQSPSGP